VIARRIESAEILAVGSELLVGETRDTNSGDLAVALTGMGIEVRRLSALADRLEDVIEALEAALARADLVITTGGLGPTPDDLTREAIAAVCNETPAVDPALEAWLHDLFDRRGVRFSDANIKQAWLIPSATALPNPNGTAPGWWVALSDGRVIVALPGPPRELLPMWRDEVVPRLRTLGAGGDRAAETLRLTGIGESLLVDLIGREVLERRNPEVATYARVDAVDVRVSTVGSADATAQQLLDRALAELMPRLEPFVFAHGDDGWADALGQRLAGRTLATVEIGTAGQLAAMLGAARWLRFSELVAADSPQAKAHRALGPFARWVREESGADVGLAVRARERHGDLALSIAVDLGGSVSQVSRAAFLSGDAGRRRAANLACAELWARLGVGATVAER
jgi:nicotinamide-nucleotide amidase